MDQSRRSHVLTDLSRLRPMVKHLQCRIKTVDPGGIPDQNCERLVNIRLEQNTHIFDTNLQKQLLLDYNQKSKTKAQEWSKFTANKKSLITIIYRQYDEATKTRIALKTAYKADS